MSLSEQVITDTVPGITNLRRIESTVACAGATTPAAMKAVKDMGFACVVNLRQASEEEANVEAESAAAASAGLRYIHLPMDSASPDREVFDRFIDASRVPENQPMFVYCRSGNRSAAMWLVKRIVVDGWTVARALEEADALGLRSEPLKQFALDYAKLRPAR